MESKSYLGLEGRVALAERVHDRRQLLADGGVLLGRLGEEAHVLAVDHVRVHLRSQFA